MCKATINKLDATAALTAAIAEAVKAAAAAGLDSGDIAGILEMIKNTVESDD